MGRFQEVCHVTGNYVYSHGKPFYIDALNSTGARIIVPDDLFGSRQAVFIVLIRERGDLVYTPTICPMCGNEHLRRFSWSAFLPMKRHERCEKCDTLYRKRKERFLKSPEGQAVQKIANRRKRRTVGTMPQGDKVWVHPNSK